MEQRREERGRRRREWEGRVCGRLREAGRGQRRRYGGRRQRCQGSDRAASGTHSCSAGLPAQPACPLAGTMVDRGPLLTSAIIFYLSIGAAIFEVLEEPHWRSATDDYKRQKTELLKQFPCLGQEGLDKILQVRRTPPRPVGARRRRRAAAAAAGAAGRPEAQSPAPLGGQAGPALPGWRARRLPGKVRPRGCILTKPGAC